MTTFRTVHNAATGEKRIITISGHEAAAIAEEVASAPSVSFASHQLGDKAYLISPGAAKALRDAILTAMALDAGDVDFDFEGVNYTAPIDEARAVLVAVRTVATGG